MENMKRTFQSSGIANVNSFNEPNSKVLSFMNFGNKSSSKQLRFEVSKTLYPFKHLKVNGKSSDQKLTRFLNQTNEQLPEMFE
jgi:hypothetical protein